MISAMAPELIAGAISASAGFLFKAHATSIQALKDLAELQLKASMTADQLANSAAERSNPKARKAIAFMVIGTLVCGLLAVAFFEYVPVSIVHQQDQKSIFWGLFKWGKGMGVTVAQGFVLPEWTGYAVNIVLGFFMGTGAAKPAI
jgi:hypothetical protein